MENVKLVGYRLIKQEYKEAVIKITGLEALDYNDPRNIAKHTTCYRTLKEAGVLDLWFEPFYEKQFEVGDWVYIESIDSSGWLNKIKTKVVQIIEPVAQYSGGDFFKVRTIEGAEGGLHAKKYRKATTEEIENATIPNIIINGYKAEFFDDYVKFGCATIHKQCFIDLYSFADVSYKNQNKGIESVTIGAGTFSTKVIKQIFDYYKNREC